ncbi:MAG: hypothetical protein ACP5IB_07800, partial [Thermoplasmata archaeon]
GYSNYYFNYAHNCNAGIKKAMEHNPKWIILSNDDIYKIYDIEILIKELNVAQEKGIDVAFPEERAKEGVAYRMNLGKTTIIRKIFYLFYSKNTRITLKLEKKYKIFLGKKFLAVGLNFPYSLFVKGYIKFINGGNFFIFNSKIFEKNYFFDETYINGFEDADLSLRIKLDNLRIDVLNYKIGGKVGTSLGKHGSLRSLRNFLNYIYFNYKYEKYDFFRI